jgi:hypothetical protein
MNVRTIVTLTVPQIDAALISAAHAEAPKSSANPSVDKNADGTATVSFQWDAGAVDCRTVVELSEKEVKDALIEAARAAVPEGNGGTEVVLLEDGTATVSFQWARKAK